MNKRPLSRWAERQYPRDNPHMPPPAYHDSGFGGAAWIALAFLACGLVCLILAVLAHLLFGPLK